MQQNPDEWYTVYNSRFIVSMSLVIAAMMCRLSMCEVRMSLIVNTSGTNYIP